MISFDLEGFSGRKDLRDSGSILFTSAMTSSIKSITSLADLRSSGNLPMALPITLLDLDSPYCAASAIANSNNFCLNSDTVVEREGCLRVFS